MFKHFPGHGHSTGDSHQGAVAVPPLDQLRTSDLTPFADLVGMPGTAVMVGHTSVPGLTQGDAPASLSPEVYRFLREQTLPEGRHYDGAVFTDDLSGMRAITDAYPLPQAVLDAIRSGADSPLWITTDGLGDVIDTLARALEDGSLPQQRVDEALTHMAALRGLGGCG